MRSLLAVSMGIFAACSSGPSGTSIALRITRDPPAYGTGPFPTDALREDGHLVAAPGLEKIAAHHSDLVGQHVAALDGYGLRPLVEFFLDGTLDPARIPAVTTDRAAPLALVDVDPASPEQGRVIAMEWRYDADRHVISGSPRSGELLREGTRYAAYATTELGLVRGEAFDQLLGDIPARWQTTADALRSLADSHIAGLAVFTTQHATAPLVAARTAMDDRATVPAPTLAFADPAIVFSGKTQLDRLLGTATRFTSGPRAGTEHWGSDNQTGIAHDHVGVIGTGQMTVVRFRGNLTGTNGPEDKTFHFDPATGIPQVIAIDSIPITFILPNTPMPAAGYPVVIYGHGLGSSRDALEAFAEPITSQGYALVGIDHFGFGSRFDATDNGNNLAGIVPMFTGDPNLKDGFGDVTGLQTTYAWFEGFLDTSAVRDSIRQSALDLGRVVELVKTPDLDLGALAGPGTASPKLDSRRVAYLGESYGTVVGTLFSAIEPDIDLFVLDVPGGGILDLITPNSPEIGGLALPLLSTIYGPATNPDRWNQLIALEQAVIDGGDPLSYATHVLAHRFTVDGVENGARSVVCLEVVGDQVLSNPGTDALARELGLGVLKPNLTPPARLVQLASPASANVGGQTGVLVQYSPATHGANWSSETGSVRFLPGFPKSVDDPFPMIPGGAITIHEPIYATYAQVDEILATHLAGQTPVVRSTLAPVADFDDDGYPDSQDAFPYDPTRH